MTQLLVLLERPYRQAIRNIVISAIGLSLLGACSTTYEKREVNYQRTEVIQPRGEISDSQLLGVRIKTFKPGKLPKSRNQARGISKEIRKAEGYFIAVQLKNTMQGTGHWGPVRVIPENGRDGEIVVSGEILESDGEILKLKISVRDASGADWFTREYGGVISEEIYQQEQTAGAEAFQFLYNHIANDIALHRQKILPKRVDKIRQIAELKFAADFSPEIFSDYLKRGKPDNQNNSDNHDEPGLFGGLLEMINFDDQTDEKKQAQYSIARLPSDDDPMYQRVKRLRAREHLLVDTLDQQYDGLARNLTEPYAQWRMSRLIEMNAIRQRENLRDKKVGQAVMIGVLGTLAGAALGSSNSCNSCVAAGGAIAATAIQIAFQQSVRASEQAEADTIIHKATLEEAGQSLAAEVKPIVLDVEGETVELTGTVEAKFQQWRDIIKKIQEREVGPLQKVPLSSAARPNTSR